MKPPPRTKTMSADNEAKKEEKKFFIGPNLGKPPDTASEKRLLARNLDKRSY